MKRNQHELLPFLALWADRYQRDYGLDGLHPVHYDLMVKYGARMDDFKRATDAPPQAFIEAKAERDSGWPDACGESTPERREG